MNFMKYFSAVGILLTSTFVYSNNLPTPEEVQGIINVCSAGRSVEVTGELDLSVKKMFSGDFKGQGQISDLGGIIAGIDDEKLKLEAYSIYVSCIMPSLSKAQAKADETKNSREESTGVSIKFEGNNNTVGTINTGDKNVTIGTINGDLSL